MNQLIEVAIKSMPEFKRLTASTAEFFLNYFELFSKPNGSIESNSYFAEKEDKGVKTIEKRFKQLRDAGVIKTTVSKFKDSYFTNKSGFITSRRNELDPVFKAKLEEKINYIKTELARRRTISGTYRKV